MKVVLGRVVGAHGVRGWIRVRIFGDDPDNLLRAARVELAREALGPDDPAPLAFEIEGGGRGGRREEVRLALTGVTDRDAAQALRSRLVVVDEEALGPPPEGEHRWYQLVGCRVVTTAGEEVGVVRELWRTAAHDVLVVDAGDGTQRLVPTAGDLLREVDVAGRRVVVEDVPGLLEPQRT